MSSPPKASSSVNVSPQKSYLRPTAAQKHRESPPRFNAHNTIVPPSPKKGDTSPRHRVLKAKTLRSPSPKKPEVEPQTQSENTKTVPVRRRPAAEFNRTTEEDNAKLDRQTRQLIKLHQPSDGLDSVPPLSLGQCFSNLRRKIKVPLSLQDRTPDCVPGVLCGWSKAEYYFEHDGLDMLSKLERSIDKLRNDDSVGPQIERLADEMMELFNVVARKYQELINVAPLKELSSESDESRKSVEALLNQSLDKHLEKLSEAVRKELDSHTQSLLQQLCQRDEVINRLITDKQVFQDQCLEKEHRLCDQALFHEELKQKMHEELRRQLAAKDSKIGEYERRLAEVNERHSRIEQSQTLARIELKKHVAALRAAHNRLAGMEKRYGRALNDLASSTSCSRATSSSFDEDVSEDSALLCLNEQRYKSLEEELYKLHRDNEAGPARTASKHEKSGVPLALAAKFPENSVFPPTASGCRVPQPAGMMLPSKRARASEGLVSSNAVTTDGDDTGEVADDNASD